MTLTPARIAAAVVLSARVAYGAALIAVPVRVGRPWIGSAAEQPATQLALRSVGGREIAVHSAALVALLRGASVRPWLLVSVGGDLTDVGATAVHRDALPDGALRATAAVAGGSALLSAILAVLLDGED